MTPGEFIEVFDEIAEAPGGIERLRELVIQLAVRGRLVPQDADDELPISILERNAKEKRCLVDQRKISNPKSLPRLSSDEVPFNVPETWQWIRLGDIALVVMGNSPPGSSYNEQGLGVPLINGPVEFSAGAFGLTICRKYTTKPNQMCTTGDMLICVRGATTGRTNIAAFDACIGRGVALVRAWDAQRYVNLYLWHVGKEFLAAGKGTTFPSISYADLAGKPLPLPPLAEQHRIVAKVDELMGLIDRLAGTRRSREDCRTAARDSALAALRNASTSEDVETAWTRIAERMDDLFTAPADLAPLREAVLQLAVRGRLVPQDEGDGGGEDLLSLLKKARIKWKIARRIRKQKDDYTFSDRYVDLPKNWTWARLYEIGQTQTGTSPSSNNADLFGDHIPFIKPGNMGGVEINYDGPSLSEEGIKHSRFVPSNSILMVCIGATLGKVNKTTQSICFNQQINSLTTYLDIDTLADYIVLALKSPDFQKLAWSKAGTGTLPIINKRKWEVLPIPLPSLAEQHRIVAKVDELMGLIDRLEQHLAAKEGTQGELAVAWAGRVETRMQ